MRSLRPALVAIAAAALSGLALASLASVAVVLASAPASAQERRVEIHFTPTIRAQIAVWVESADGTQFRTLGLTEAVSYRGIGNRPGALQMNSGFHWPYGRREGVLPVWAHRRYDATGVLFPRIIFAGRDSEGNASSAGSSGEIVNTRDNAFCLSFRVGDESLDAVSCASVFMSNKGRYLRETDVSSGYSEPWEETGGSARMRPLGLGSLYPPRQDLDCEHGCADHADTRTYESDTRAVMPDIDAVSMATPPGDVPALRELVVPDEWPDGDYVAFVEVNTEGDHAPGWDVAQYPTPRQPNGQWDTWAINNGYPYRGQPSIVYQVPFRIDSGGGEWSAVSAAGYGELQGLDGDIHAMDGTIRDDSAGSPGSGADRLRSDPAFGGARVRVVVPSGDACQRPDAPPDCGRECGVSHACPMPLLCGPEGACVDRCALDGGPEAPASFVLETYPEQRFSHEYARMRFAVPESMRGIRRYEVRVGLDEIVDDATFAAARPAKAATLEDEGLVVPVAGETGDVVEIDLGKLQPETRYFVGIRAYDECSAPGPIAVAEIETTAIHFTTVSPCFVATAAYGSPLDGRIGELRRFRDRHLLTNAIGRSLVDAYYAVGPAAAAWIAEDEDRRAAARAVLMPIVALVEWID